MYIMLLYSKAREHSYIFQSAGNQSEGTYVAAHQSRKRRRRKRNPTHFPWLHCRMLSLDPLRHWVRSNLRSIADAWSGRLVQAAFLRSDWSSAMDLLINCSYIIVRTWVCPTNKLHPLWYYIKVMVSLVFLCLMSTHFTLRLSKLMCNHPC